MRIDNAKLLIKNCKIWTHIKYGATKNYYWKKKLLDINKSLK